MDQIQFALIPADGGTNTLHSRSCPLSFLVYMIGFCPVKRSQQYFDTIHLSPCIMFEACCKAQ